MKLAVTAIAFVLAASGSAGAADNWDQVIAAAKKEAAVTMYCNSGNEAQLEAAAASFQKLYGIEVTLSHGSGALNAQRVMAEAQTGHVKGDLLSSGLGPLSRLNNAGFAIALDPPNAANIISAFDVLKTATPLFVNVYGILVNTSRLGSVKAPVSWAALINPAFAGKMVMQDPRVDSGGGVFFISTYDRLGRSWETALAALHPTINGSGSGEAAEEATARGDYTVMIAGRAHAIEAYPQAPLKWIAPAEGSIAVPVAMTMIKGAPHPNAARLWANYLLRPDIQSTFSTSVLPVVKNAAIKSPVVKLGATGKFLEVLPPSQDRTKYFAVAKELYGAQ
jgi:iron(III) transport system substrate-binding protein